MALIVTMILILILHLELVLKKRKYTNNKICDEFSHKDNFQSDRKKVMKKKKYPTLFFWLVTASNAILDLVQSSGQEADKKLAVAAPQGCGDYNRHRVPGDH